MLQSVRDVDNHKVLIDEWYCHETEDQRHGKSYHRQTAVCKNDGYYRRGNGRCRL